MFEGTDYARVTTAVEPQIDHDTLDSVRIQIRQDFRSKIAEPQLGIIGALVVLNVKSLGGVAPNFETNS